MSLKAKMREIAAHLNAGAFEQIEPYFADDFRLSDPNHALWPRGRDGARQMADSFAALAENLKADILDMVEENDRVVVRWAFTGKRAGAPFVASILAIYRFENGLIAEDWGVGAAAPWP